jgi:hypothetical protein
MKGMNIIETTKAEPFIKMQIRIFTIPILDNEGMEAEFNGFLSGNKILERDSQKNSKRLIVPSNLFDR